MVARTPPKQQRKVMVAPLNSTLIRETVKKVDQCMARLQELQYTVNGGNKVVAGVNLSPRSTRGYLKASLRCKQESARNKRSPTGKLPGDWRRTSLPAMLVGETVGEILKASKFATDIVEKSSDPKTPVSVRRKQRPMDNGIESRRKREKQQNVRSESNTPAVQRARSRINFKVPSPKLESKSIRYSANRVSPRNRPWGKKAVMFPNPVFNSSPTSQRQKNKSPSNNTTPHKFVIKSPNSKFQVRIRSPVGVPKLSPPNNNNNRRASPLKKMATATAAKIRRSLSPARLASRMMSPMKSRRYSVVNGGVNERPVMVPMISTQHRRI